MNYFVELCAFEPLCFKILNHKATKTQRITKKNNKSLYFFQSLIHIITYPYNLL